MTELVRQDIPQTAEVDRTDLRVIGLDGFVPYLLNTVSARYNAHMAEQLRAQGLTTPQMRALAVLAVHPELTVNALAVYAVMEQSTMSRTLDGMVDAGLVVRRQSEDDRRVRVVSLTPAGTRAFNEVWPLMRDAEARLMDALPDEGREAFLLALRSILMSMVDEPTEDG
ncbi:MAG: MarR family winged helix-turn-helix transcriptional regulator [Pseudomonadota bacterium]